MFGFERRRGRRGEERRGVAVVEGPLSGKEWRGRKMGAKEELEWWWWSQCVRGEGREKKEGREGRREQGIDGEGESIDRRERGPTEVG